MQSNPSCPVCSSISWKTVGSRTYRTVETSKLSPYTRKRLEVLFNVWFPGTPTVTLTSVLCEKCGFICYAPRPDEHDINRKYAFLAGDDVTQHEISETLLSDDKRSQDLFERVGGALAPDASILDFGGGNGRLMKAFLTRGHHCYLIDYPGTKLPHIRHLGSQLSDIPAAMKFDLIVCSHVLEHLAAPYGVVDALRNHLAPGGIFYVEVPLEIWKGAPLPSEPVTHVNYFTVDSLRILLERANYRVIACEEGLYTTENGAPGLAIRARAGRAEHGSVAVRYERSASAALRLTQPGPIQQLVRAFKYPTLTWKNVSSALHQCLGKTPLLWRLVAGKVRT
ncbi:class I SAM-dependent methyltransferase [Aromatoleum bremense]|uniref:Methyltransferase domain-containing protein n=1 Tax=Aromatoleum bremense TaxID=76115 RepID=A0ABX1NWZ7_9RHOO|nr:class I SAM-dependent methyltransferase [Aromatoleum bremense]NMG16544.1 methyltransferase domain-containing protein [Aromatoleum bremense]QTQ32805.1 SAM-dependent methyltransferase [Aromatoleum bremense]